jgi:putative ABC transport system substrate-binding protein
MIQNMSMNRVLSALIVAVALACWPRASNAQGESKIFRIGFIALVSPKITEQWTKAFGDELRKFGYEEGKNLVIEARFANGNRDKLQDLVSEIARAKVDVFLTAGEPALIAAKAYGQNIPIVTVSCDPLEKLMGSLARPGGNATGSPAFHRTSEASASVFSKACCPKVSVSLFSIVSRILSRRSCESWQPKGVRSE